MRHRRSFAVGAAAVLLTTFASGLAWSSVAARPGHDRRLLPEERGTAPCCVLHPRLPSIRAS